MKLSYRTDWPLPTGDTADAYKAAKGALAKQSDTGWLVWKDTLAAFVKANPPGWCVGIYAGNKRSNETLVSAQLIGVDYDDYPDEDSLVKHPFIQRYAYAVGYTPSHGQPWRTGARLRVLFYLDSPIESHNEPDEKPVYMRYMLAVKALMTQLPTGFDDSCKDGARFFFGCQKWPYIWPDHVLPMAQLRAWYQEAKRQEDAERQDVPNAPLSYESMSAYAAAARDNEMSKLASQTEPGRYSQLFKSACALYELVKAGILVKMQIDNELEQTARGIGLDAGEIKHAMKDAWDRTPPRDLTTVNIRPTPGAANGSTPLSVPPTTPPAPVSFVFSDDAYEQSIDEINGDAIPTVSPILNPYEFLHEYEGFAKMLMPGKIMYLASVSGGGKTIGVECGVESCMMRGLHNGIYSPEWTDGKSKAQELAARSIQRNGGPDYQAQMLHKLYLIEQANGVKNGAGKRMKDGDISRHIAAALRMKRLPGKNFYLDDPGLSVEKICSGIAQLVPISAEMGYPIRTAWLDFAQLLWLENDPKGRTWIEAAISLFKTVCRDYNLVGFVTSQMRKDDAEGVKDGKALEANMMQWLSDQQANLVLMFVQDNYENGKPVLGLDGNPRLRSRIVKDSMKGPSTEFYISWNPQQLRWLHVCDTELAKGKVINL